MAKIKNVESLCERELLEKILHTVEKHEKALAQHQMPQNHLYDNKALMIMATLDIHVKETNIGILKKM